MADEKQIFGVFQRPTGSYTFGGVRFPPVTAVPAKPEVAPKADQELVRFFKTKETADADVARLKAEFERKAAKKK